MACYYEKWLWLDSEYYERHDNLYMLAHPDCLPRLMPCHARFPYTCHIWRYGTWHKSQEYAGGHQEGVRLYALLVSRCWVCGLWQSAHTAAFLLPAARAFW